MPGIRSVLDRIAGGRIGPEALELRSHADSPTLHFAAPPPVAGS